MTIDKTVESQMKKNQSLVERIGLYIPIYRGYKEKNLRREEDRAVRTEVARVLERVKLDLVTIQRATVNDLDLMRDTERIRSKADRYYIDVKKAVNGYSAFHDAVKIMESELDALIEWDAKLMDDAAALKKETEELVQRIDAGETKIKVPLRELETQIDKLLEDYNERESVMRGFKE
jgi:predicted  nucleic acid-binding Zn-ribbon protein